MTFEMICKRCLAEYEAAHDDIAKGIKWWALCPACRPKDESESEEEA